MKKDKIMGLEKLIQEDDQTIAGIVVCKEGDYLYENYFNGCNENSSIHIFSVTKSVVSLLLGIAMDKGYIQTLDQEILEFFPNYQVKQREKKIQMITLRDLVTMTAPYKDKMNPYTKYFSSSDWVEFSLDLLGGDGQIGEFHYTPLIGPDILSGILTKVTGKSVLEFAQETLFLPLGIEVDQSITFRDKEEQMAFYEATTISCWVADAKGTNAAGWGLTLTTRDMAKIGQLCLNEGNWEGEQIVSQKWLADSLEKHSRWEKMKLDYGYLWWLIDENDQSFAAVGDGGNVIYVNRKNSIVISVAARFAPNVTNRIEFIKEMIEPLFVE